MRPDEVLVFVRESFPGAHVEVEDMTGTGDHFQILVVSEAFRGVTLIDQHRQVQKSLQAAFEDGRIHAVRIQTETPERWNQRHSGGGDLPVIK